MKRKVITALIIIACVIVAGIILFNFFLKTEPRYVKDISNAEFKKAYDTLSNSYLNEGEEAVVYYTDFIAKNSEIGEGEASANVEDGISTSSFYEKNKNDENVPKAVKDYSKPMKSLEYQDKAKYNITVDKSGLYYLTVDYISVGSSLSNYTVSMTVNGKQEYSEMNTVRLPITWKDTDDKNFVSSKALKTFPKDGYGDDMTPKQEKVQQWEKDTYLYNNTYTSTTPLCFYLKKGSNEVTLENVSSGGLGIGSLKAIEAKDKTKSYKEYSKVHGKDPVIKDDKYALQIDGVNYYRKNSTEITYDNDIDDSLTRFNIDYKKLNILKWGEAGVETTYTFDVKKTGNYNLALHFKNGKKEFKTFETIKLDGKVPFTEMYNYEFSAEQSDYQNALLKDKKDNPYKFYLTKGKHTITIKQENAPIMEAYRYALLIEQHVTNFDLEIKKITGAEVDENRNWKMTKYIKNIDDYLDSYSDMIQHIRYLLQDYSKNGNAGAVLAYLDQADIFIKNMKEYPDDIALHTQDLTGPDNSILVALSSFVQELTNNEFTLDRIYICGDKDQLGKANSSFGSSLWTGIKSLLNTFVTDKYDTKISEDKDTITIWFNKATTHVNLLQKMASSDFVKYYKEKTGKDIKVHITAIPDPSKFTLAIAAKKTPDVAMGLMSFMPFDLCSRGALYDFTKFPDFWQVANRFPTGAFVSYVYNEGVYAVPEQTDFNAVVYRKDIFKQLEIKVPDNWDELIDILPTLQRYGKNFYHNISLGVTGYKWFYQTAPMILQNGGQLYVQDKNGIVKTGVDSKNAIRGMQLLGDLFNKYSLDTSVNSFFNSFRYSTLPIGIIGMEDYTLIKNGAPELDGEWEIAPYIGTKQKDGVTNRTFVANGTGATIMKDSKKKEAAWEFIKWWTSKDVQTEYTNTLTSSYGKTYFWLSSNLDALQNNPMDEKDKNVMLKQINWVTDVTRTPGQYLLERTISNIWTNMVFDGVSAQVSVDEKKADVNKEITRKMTELGYYNDKGKLVKKFKLRGYDWIKKNQEDALKKGGKK